MRTTCHVYALLAILAGGCLLSVGCSTEADQDTLAQEDQPTFNPKQFNSPPPVRHPSTGDADTASHTIEQFVEDLEQLRLKLGADKINQAFQFIETITVFPQNGTLQALLIVPYGTRTNNAVKTQSAAQFPAIKIKTGGC